MTLLFCIHSLYNPGGMERVLLNKVRWLLEHPEKGPFRIVVATTDQKGRPTFYPFPDGVEFVDFGVDYSDDNGKNFILKTLGFLRRRRTHRKALEALLTELRPDVTDCFYPGECSFVPDMKDGSRKVLELHQSKLFHLQYNRSGLMGLADRWRAGTDERLVRRFDRFVVLTEEDARMWGEIPTMRVIPNSAVLQDAPCSELTAKRVIAVGRLDYQKSFDRLIEAWRIVHGKAPEWRLDIFGQGEWKERLQQQIADCGLEGCCAINAPTADIVNEYAASSLLVMSSHYEGFPMVLIEGMACGLPAVSFDYKCGPRDIIRDGVDGFIARDGDVADLARKMLLVIGDEQQRRRMGQAAREVVRRFSPDSVMEKWLSVYKDA
ncbi:MAG: glycosyltransferase family 4 protein [Candidatus Cryptobacteroides sp.]|uniref:glycosyltransferase family 4 protein n=1 Tax=Candidatus Cryptobacteroides sp. TaxID=2952915 RepID=UPI002A81B1B0|nr:glycosyltransferase family 4 protein [Candidatus Cryptobacteroides sp.]MDY5044030.1 glycosyltransferase family 4 protein [Candidatus Cryptobacteroides sp.]